MKEEGAQRRWKGGGAEEVREAGPYHLSVWYWCSLLQLSVLHRMSGECHQVPPSGAPPPKGTTPDPPRAHPGPTPGPPLQNTLTLHPTSPWLSAPWPLILAPSCFVTHPSSVILFILMTGWWEGPRDLPPGGYKWCLCLAPGESLLGPFRSR